MIISLVGFMGTGKSSVGRKLANRLNYKFVDTDDLIEKKIKLTIPKIFSQYGEKVFRKLEEDVLADILKNNSDMIIATGGGIVLSAKNRKKLKGNTSPVLLLATPDEICKRIGFKKRPLLADVHDQRAKIEELLNTRKNAYYKFKKRVKTDNKSQEQIVNEIIKLTGVEKSE